MLEFCSTKDKTRNGGSVSGAASAESWIADADDGRDDEL